MNDPQDIREWNYQQMTGEDSMTPDNPSGHPMIVPQSTPTRQPVELPVERLALVSRVEFDAVERELAEVRRERDEAVAAWKRVSLEAEHWLSLASKRKDECDEANNERDRLAERVAVLDHQLAEALKRGDDALEEANIAKGKLAWSDIQDKLDLVMARDAARDLLAEAREQRDRLAEAIRLVLEDSELPNGHFWPDVVEKCRTALAAVKGGKP